MPKLTIRRFIKRVPSSEGGRSVPVTWRNLTGKKLIVLWINSRGKLQFSRSLEAGQVMKRSAQIGHRYEAHYFRNKNRDGQHYIRSLPLTSFVTTPGAVWEIKRWGK